MYYVRTFWGFSSIIWLKYSATFPIFSSFVMPKWITLPSNGTSFWPFLLAFAMNCKENWCKVKALALTTSSKKPFLLKAGIYILLLSPHQVVGIVSDFYWKWQSFGQASQTQQWEGKLFQISLDPDKKLVLNFNLGPLKDLDGLIHEVLAIDWAKSYLRKQVETGTTGDLIKVQP